jgi:hypothetical protein
MRNCTGMLSSREQTIALHRPKGTRQPLRTCPSGRAKLRKPLRTPLQSDHNVKRPLGRRPFERKPHRRCVGTRSNDRAQHN